MAAPTHQLPSLAHPVSLTGEEADRFLAELPADLAPDEKTRLREAAADAASALSEQSANDFFA